MDKARSFSWLNFCSQSEGNRTSVFVPIIASNLRDVLHITKTVPNYAHLMWVPWLNFVQLGAAAWWRIQQLHESSPSLQQMFQEWSLMDLAAEIDLRLWWNTWCDRAANLHGTDFMILQTLCLVPNRVAAYNMQYGEARQSSHWLSPNSTPGGN